MQEKNLKMKKINLILANIVLLSALSTFSQEVASPPSSEDVGVPTQSKKNTVYDFSEVDISGKLKKPEGKSIVEAPEFRFKRLLDLDESFIPNLIRSVDDF